MTRLPFLLTTLFPIFLLAQMPTQTLRGTVVDALTSRPLAGATITLPDTDGPLGNVTDESGHFMLREVPIGHYRLQASYVGYGTLILANVNVEAGKETIQFIQLSEQAGALGEVIVKAQGRGTLGHPVSLHTLTVEEQFHYPATFFDPARVATSYPGVAAPDDQANHLSIRGNSPNALRWRVEGADIVNPNHTANAGTFSDRPSSAGGGVSILSAQVLDVSNFLTGAFPSGYGNSIGGVMDMRFRHGNDRHHEFTAQAGLIGLEVAAEGPFQFGSLSSSAVRQSASSTVGSPSTPSEEQGGFLVNYRYSFTGLLTAFGVDFGGEEIGFQDLSFHLDFPTEKAGEFGVFGLGGASENIFTSPRESIVEEKELYDIGFQSKMGAIGLTHILPTGKKSVWRTVLALSALEHGRTAERVALVPEPFLWDDDEITERKLALSSVFSQKTKAGNQLRAGIQATQEHAVFSSFANDNAGGSELSGKMDGWLLQPFAEWQKRLSAKWKLVTGLHLSHFTFSEKTFLEPRASLSFSATEKAGFHLAYGLHSQSQLPQVHALSKTGGSLSPTRSHHVVLGYRQNFPGSRVLTAEVYYQSLFEVPVSETEGSVFSTINLTEFTEFKNEKLVSEGSARNYGLDVSMQRFWHKGRYAIASGSLYRSLFTAADDRERPSRWDGGYLLSGSSGREKKKLTKKGKTRTFGSSTRAVWMGGFRERPIDVAYSEATGRTMYVVNAEYSKKLGHYFRFDLRIYWKWERPRRSSMLSFDFQNVSGRENDAFHYFDQVERKVKLKKQLGLIPILSWRAGF